MLDLNNTLDNLIAMVVVLLALSLVVQAVQSAVKKMFKLKSRQIEDSLAHLFQFVIDNSTAAQTERGGQGDFEMWAAKWKGFMAMITQSPFLRIFALLPGVRRLFGRWVAHPAQDARHPNAAALYNEVLNGFRGLGRTALSTRPIFDSLSKGDLLKVVASIEPDKVDAAFDRKFGAAVEEFGKFQRVFLEWEGWFGGPEFAAAGFLGDDDRARLAELQTKFRPLVSDLRLLLTGETGAGHVLESLARDVAKLRAINLDDVQRTLDAVRANVALSAERARLDRKEDVAAGLGALAGRLRPLSEGFAAFRRTYQSVFANWVKLEESFDSVMQSFEERYTRSMKTAAVVISFLVVLFLNANFFTVYESISTSDAKRELILQSRQQVVEALARGAQAAAPAGADQAARDAQTQQTVKSWFDASRKEIDEHADYFIGYGFKPVTLEQARAWLVSWWTGSPWANLRRDLWALLGMLLMALLLSVGAPFWQDFLESLFGVKNVLRKRSGTQNVEQAPGAGQPRQA